MKPWVKKLSSRKFWASLAGFVTAVLVAFNVREMTVAQVTTILGGLGTLVAYIFAEGMADASAATGTQDTSDASNTDGATDSAQNRN